MERFERLNGRQKASPKQYREESVAQLTADIDSRLHEAEKQPICTKEQQAKKPEEDQQSAEDDRMDSPTVLWYCYLKLSTSKNKVHKQI